MNICSAVCELLLIIHTCMNNQWISALVCVNTCWSFTHVQILCSIVRESLLIIYSCMNTQWISALMCVNTCWSIHYVWIPNEYLLWCVWMPADYLPWMNTQWISALMFVTTCWSIHYEIECPVNICSIAREYCWLFTPVWILSEFPLWCVWLPADLFTLYE